MKSLKSLILAGTTLALASGCVTNSKYTAPDTSRLSKNAMKALETSSIRSDYILPTQLPFEQKEVASKQYSGLAPYSGEVLIFKGQGSSELKVHAPLYTTGPNNSVISTVKEMENQFPAGARSYSFNLAPQNEAARRQLSTRSGLFGIENYTSDPDKSAVRVTVEQTDSIKKGFASDSYKIKLSFGEANFTINHKITDTRTPAKIGAAGAIGVTIAGIPGAVVIGGGQAVISGIEYSNGGKLPANTRITENNLNANNLEGKVGAVYNTLANASSSNAKKVIIFPYSSTGTAAILTDNVTGVTVGPNKELGLKPNELFFTTDRKGANECLQTLYWAAGAGLIRLGNFGNEGNNLNGLPFDSTGGRTGGPGGSSGSSGGRTGAPGGGP